MGLVVQWSGPQTLTFFVRGGYLVTRVRISAGPHVFCCTKRRYGYVLHTDSEDVRVVKELVLRSNGAIRVGSIPTPRNFYDTL